MDDQKNDTGENITRRKNFKAANTIRLKYVDDLSMAEAIKMKEKLVSVPVSERPLPDTFHARTGHVLPREQSALHHQLLETQQYAKDN